MISTTKKNITAMYQPFQLLNNGALSFVSSVISFPGGSQPTGHHYQSSQHHPNQNTDSYFLDQYTKYKAQDNSKNECHLSSSHTWLFVCCH